MKCKSEWCLNTVCAPATYCIHCDLQRSDNDCPQCKGERVWSRDNSDRVEVCDMCDGTSEVIQGERQTKCAIFDCNGEAVGGEPLCGRCYEAMCYLSDREPKLLQGFDPLLLAAGGPSKDERRDTERAPGPSAFDAAFAEAERLQAEITKRQEMYVQRGGLKIGRIPKTSPYWTGLTEEEVSHVLREYELRCGAPSIKIPADDVHPTMLRDIMIRALHREHDGFMSESEAAGKIDYRAECAQVAGESLSLWIEGARTEGDRR